MDASLERLAHACGVATTYDDWAHRPVAVSEATVRRVLEGLGIDASDPAQALTDWQERSWARVLPSTVVVRRGEPAPVALRCPAKASIRAEIRIDAEQDAIELPFSSAVDRERDRIERHLNLPSGLPVGEHRLVAEVDGAEFEALLIVAPDHLPLPTDRLWGWMAQLYAITSAWGMGDYADLAELATWGAQQGAGLLLVNPLHAAGPVPPLQNSPYFPASRRFHSPLYLRPELLPEYASAPSQVRERVDAAAVSAPVDSPHIDRDGVWAAKTRALEALFSCVVTRPEAEDSDALTDFATWSALAEQHGPDWRKWPEALQDPRSPAVEGARTELAERIAYHRWLQHCCAEQLAAAQNAATQAGMPVGIVHDLAVGVDPGGADAWALQTELATGFSIGAPPDSFNQRGQDWGLPPWRPDRLAETGYAPIRDMVRAVLRAGGGLRIDHILGLFRLWWVPDGCPSSEGTYVSYDADALLGIIALEAERAGGLVVGEDLGTVPDAVRDTLAQRDVLGSTVLWFERDKDGALVPPARWRPATMASVTTHDLPTAAGFLTGTHVRVRAELGLLNDPAAEEKAAAGERAEMLTLMVAEGVIARTADLEEQILGLHALLTRSPCRVLLAALGDAVGDLRQPNLPATVDEYPNWRLPIADGQGRVLSRDALCGSPGTARLAKVMRDGI